MRPYEVVIIFDAGLEEEVIASILDRAAETVRAHDGNIGRTDRWGRRRFAYELNHRSEGYYVLVEMTASPAAVAELDRVLSLADEVLRHKTIRIPDAAAGRARPAAAPAEPALAESGAQQT
jgi:small subunit ribosomal protein S6